MGFFDKIQETITGAAEQTKAKVDETQFKSERKRKLEAVGEQAYSLWSNGQLANPELVPALQEVREVDERIATAQAAAQAARPQPAPPAAGQPSAPAPSGAPAPPAPPAPPAQAAAPPAPPAPPATPEAQAPPQAASAPPPPPPGFGETQG